MKDLNKILIVDDDKISILLTKKAIEKFDPNIKVDSVLNGKEALSYLEKCTNGATPGLVLLDIRMPVMDGFEFLEEFETRDGQFSKIPIAILSTSSFEKDKEKAFNYNIVEYVEKPMTPEILNSLRSKLLKEVN